LWQLSTVSGTVTQRMAINSIPRAHRPDSTSLWSLTFPSSGQPPLVSISSPIFSRCMLPAFKQLFVWIFTFRNAQVVARRYLPRCLCCGSESYSQRTVRPVFVLCIVFVEMTIAVLQHRQRCSVPTAAHLLVWWNPYVP